MLVDPSATMGPVKGPAQIHLSNTLMGPAAGGGGPHQAGGHAGSAPGVGAHHAPGDDAARAAIASGAAKVAGEDAEAKASYAKKRRDAEDRNRHIKGDVD